MCICVCVCARAYRCPPNNAYIVRPPEGMCGYGATATPVWPAKVFTLPSGGYGVEWECCRAKGLASNQLLPSHHSNKTVTPLDCPVAAMVAFTPPAVERAVV